jgi:hypothetical protein
MRISSTIVNDIRADVDEISTEIGKAWQLYPLAIRVDVMTEYIDDMYERLTGKTDIVTDEDDEVYEQIRNLYKKEVR